jgi:CheY-like chemotaxis protein
MEADPVAENSFPHLLLADGDPDDQEFFCSALQQAHPEVRVSILSNGQALLDFLEAYTEAVVPACIVIEYRLPVLSGPEVLQAIGFLPRYKDVPKVIWSHLAMEQQIDECLRLGAAGVIIKPNSLAEMQGVIESVYSFFAVKQASAG